MRQEDYMNAVQIMENHMKESLSLPGLAKEVGFSESYLNAIFLHFAQMPPMRFYTLMRIRRACSLLEKRQICVHQVAKEVGYENPFYFSKLFKKTVGMPPSHYKHVMQENVFKYRIYS